jgi:uncharacterized protein YegL
MMLFFIIDASGSMEGSKIGTVNAAIEDAIPAIKEVSDGNADAQIKIAALEFSSGARWLTPNGPVDSDQYRWNDIEAGGVTDFGAACKALNEKLSFSSEGFMREATGSFAPVLFLLSDGEPTDDWKHALQELKQNNWFKAASKVAIAIGGDANTDILKEFTGTMEAVLEVHTPAMLKKMIQFVSVRSSQITSKGSDVGDANAPEADGDQAKQEALNDALRGMQEEAAAKPDNTTGVDGEIW